MDQVQRAVDLFVNGLNCSQAMLTAFGKHYGLDPDTARRLGRALGGGIGRQGTTCGALTGAALVLGLAAADDDETQAKNITARLVRELFQRFRSARGTIDCRTLLGEDISTEEGMKKIKEANLFHTICPDIVRDAAEILESLLQEDSPNFR
jgi:C_GCAxxG_C_C family probable redox protein